jgi:acyl-coenzyme A thioesterase PaaI-like protein
MATAFRPARWHSAVLRGRDGAGPYFASVLPHVVRMEPGLAEVRVPKWFMVYNHLHTVHAIAACNAAEVAMGMLMEATVPRSHRWIPKAYMDRVGAAEGHHLAAGTGCRGPAGFHADHRGL